MQYAIVDTKWGAFGLVASDSGLAAAFLPRPREVTLRAIHAAYPDADERPSLMRGLQSAVRDYFAGKRVRFDVDFDLSAMTAFQQSVLRACAAIPSGSVVTYADLAKSAGRPAASRAVGQALGRNPIPLIIPCHRVLRVGGGLGGFSSSEGVAEKRRLLRHEGVELAPSSRRSARPAVHGAC